MLSRPWPACQHILVAPQHHAGTVVHYTFPGLRTYTRRQVTHVPARKLMPRTLPIVNAIGEVPVVEAFQDAIMEFFLGTTTVDSALAHSQGGALKSLVAFLA